jgi:lipopolysaccharide transport system permease protein
MTDLAPLSGPKLEIRTPGRASIAPTAIARLLVCNRALISRLARRELEARYRGSRLGVTWIVLMPLLMLAVYTFAFGFVLQARWGQSGEASPGSYALFLFSGLVVFNLFAETVARAPGLLLENVSYIKKMMFPLEILPVVAVLVALVNAAIGFALLLVMHLVLQGPPPVTAALVLVPLVPLVLLVLGATWFLAALGVYLRDLRQAVGVGVNALMFLSPVFYPLSLLPDNIRQIVQLNPLAPIIETTRDLVFFGVRPDWPAYGIATMASAAIAWLGFAWFAKTRRGFADVV